MFAFTDKLQFKLNEVYFAVYKVFNELKGIFSLRHLLNLFEVNLNLDCIIFSQDPIKCLVTIVVVQRTSP